MTGSACAGNGHAHMRLSHVAVSFSTAKLLDFALTLVIALRCLPMYVTDEPRVLSADEVTWLEAQGWRRPEDSSKAQQVDPANTDSSTPGEGFCS